MRTEPANPKYRKVHKGRISSKPVNNKRAFGRYVLRSMQGARIGHKQVEAARKTITRTTNRQGRLWIRIFPDLPVTAKPTAVRMGKGKGAVDRWVTRVRPRTIIFELEGVVNKVTAKEAFRRASAKLSVKTLFEDYLTDLKISSKTINKS